MQDLRLYVALGDSISIDLYPEMDVEARHPDRWRKGLGAASLLVRNHDALWPEFEGRDLESLIGRVPYHGLAEDGAETSHVLSDQIASLPRDRGGTTLVTITAGGNDLLSNLLTDDTRWQQIVARTVEKLRGIVRAVRDRYARPRIILGTVYDPTDGSGDFGDGLVQTEALRWLGVYNQAVESVATETGCDLADIHRHFLSHGLSEPRPEKRWFWEPMIIEPSAIGASELRRLWLECLGLLA